MHLRCCLSYIFISLVFCHNAYADQVIADDLVVQSSICAGVDCVNNESFGFDTLRLKAASPSIHFLDTSTSAGFPNNDWRIVVNDTSTKHFAIEDATAARTVFKLMAGAPANSIFLNANGKLGLKTAAPAQDLHIASGNTPAVRLEQTNGGGFTAQTWDVGGNDSNFFVRDNTSSPARIPFRILPGAPTSSLDISASGMVGMGTTSPLAPLHVSRTDGTAQLRIEEASASSAARTLLSLSNNGPIIASYDPGSGTVWETRAAASSWTIATASSPGGQFALDAAGNLTISGTLSQGSSRSLKTDIVETDREDLLSKLLALPLYSWRYKDAPAGDRHISPMAEDFHRLFGTGNNPERLAPSDVAGAALGAVQALADKLTTKAEQIARIQARIAALESRLGLARQE